MRNYFIGLKISCVVEEREENGRQVKGTYYGLISHQKNTYATLSSKQFNNFPSNSIKITCKSTIALSRWPTLLTFDYRCKIHGHFADCCSFQGEICPSVEDLLYSSPSCATGSECHFHSLYSWFYIQSSIRPFVEIRKGATQERQAIWGNS